MSNYLPIVLGFFQNILVSGAVVVYLDYRKDKREQRIREGKTGDKILDVQIDEVKSLRQDLKDLTARYEDKLAAGQKNLDEWRGKYYELFEKYAQIMASSTELRDKYNELLMQIKELK